MISSPVVTSARRILRRRSGIVALVAAFTALCLGAVGWLAAGGTLLYLGIGWLVVLGAAALWSLAEVLRTRVPNKPVVLVDRGNSAGLLDLVAEIAETLAVEPPDDVALTPGCEVRLEHHGRRIVLEVGAPLLWALDRQQLRAILAPAVAAGPELRHPAVRQARKVTRRLELAEIDGRVTAPLLRHLRTVARRHGAALEMGVVAAAVSRSAALYRPDLDRKVATVRDTWDMLLTEFAVPALRRGLRPNRLCSGFAGLASGSDIVAKRTYVPAWSAAKTLLTDADWIDRAVSKTVAHQLWTGRVNDAVDWTHYTERVLGPLRRQQAAELLAAVDTVMGSPGPGTLERVLDVIDLGAGPTIAATLVRNEFPEASEDVETDLAVTALNRRLAALIECAAVTSGRGRLVMSWLTGAAVVNGHGCVLALDDDALELAALGDTSDLRAWLSDHSLSLTDPVWVSGDEAPDVGPVVLATMRGVWHRRRLYDLLVCADRLVFVHDKLPIDMLRVAGRLSSHGTDKVSCLERRIRGDLADLLGKSRHSFQIELADIVDTQLRALRRPQIWRCVIATTDRRVVVRNGRSRGSAVVLSEVLRPSLGDRFRVRGLDSPTPAQKPLLAG